MRHSVNHSPLRPPSRPSDAIGSPQPARPRYRPIIDPLDRPTYALLVAWVLAMISVPIQRWTMGDSIIPFAVTLGVVLQVATALAASVRLWGVQTTVRLALTVAVLAWAVEFVGSHTGFPFGTYSYTPRLQPQIGGVPLLIPLAWLMLLPSAWAVAAAIGGRWRGLRFVALSALAFTAWDLFLDPQMVGWDFWRWDMPGAPAYFGIPLVNYAGWLLASALLTLAARPAAPDTTRQAAGVVPLLVIYGVTWALQTVGQIVFWGLVGPGVVGGVGMGALFVAALLALRRARQQERGR